MVTYTLYTHTKISKVNRPTRYAWPLYVFNDVCYDDRHGGRCCLCVPNLTQLKTLHSSHEPLFICLYCCVVSSVVAVVGLKKSNYQTTDI